MKPRLALCTALFLALAHTSTAVADKKPINDLPVKFKKFHVSYELHPEGENITRREQHIQILKEEALEQMKNLPITYSTSAESLDVKAAYTLKPDGSRKEVPKSNYQLEVNSGKDENSPPAFSDETTLTLIFPELEVNDVMVLEYVVRQKEQYFPGQFSVLDTFPVTEVHEDVQIDLDAPASMPIRTKVYGFTEVSNSEENGRRKIHWTYSNPQAFESERPAGSVYKWGAEPSYLISSFSSYRDIATAYGERAKKKAAVSERVQKLANQIAEEKKGEPEVTQALYEWVSKNISYAGNCIGVGAVVPRDLDFVLDNKMGDCKDHATLLQALLTAKGIQSTQALINAGLTYDLPPLPLVSSVNHVITYVPSLKMFLDSTAENQPFGSLPGVLEGKPVLLVDGFQEDLRARSNKPLIRKSKMNSSLELLPDGRAKGETDVTYFGSEANAAFLGYQKATPEAFQKFREKLIETYKLEDNFKMKTDYKENSRDKFRMTFSYEVKKLFKLGNPQGMKVFAFFDHSAVNSVAASLAEAKDEGYDFPCSGVEAEEIYSYRFPKTVKVLAIPEPLKVNDEFVSYTSEYSQKGSTVLVKRHLIDKTQGPICPSAVAKSYQESGTKLQDDIKSQIVFK